MEQLIIGILFIIALAIIINRVRKLFDQDCGIAAKIAVAANLEYHSPVKLKSTAEVDNKVEEE